MKITRVISKIIKKLVVKSELKLLTQFQLMIPLIIERNGIILDAIV